MEDVNITQLELLKKRIPLDLSVFMNELTYEDVLIRLLEDSKFYCLSLRYPFQDFSNIELPTKYYNWQLRCAVEMYNNIGREGITTYSENGISWSRFDGDISSDLRQEILPMAGV